MRKSIKKWFQIKNIENGIIERRDGSLCKVIEVYPINFSLKSKNEQESILYNYRNFFNICNFDMQILVQSKRGNLDNHILQIEKNIEKEKNEKIINLMKEYIDVMKKETLKSAMTKKFFIIFSSGNLEKTFSKEQALVDLQEKALKIKDALNKCGNGIKEFDKNNNELIDIIYTYMNPITSEIQKFKEFNYEYKN